MKIRIFHHSTLCPRCRSWQHVLYVVHVNHVLAVVFARSGAACFTPTAACFTPTTAFKAFWMHVVVFKAFLCGFLMSVAAFTALLMSVVAFRVVL